ncbi:metallophosphoesterase family protein [Caloramator proteoclasticus]|uniref:DNA repair exonuclease SbcCD nuclease subunit n=1 Tax=Caloramator proteoclasticus DSM 10124 TaxID=1121262 RepID=A0A1M4SP51_9CLOT|nr:metallophosphoesterase [Caloramator proteoclasticus]SHE33981.1 DNA repair exonuclease SbcCD nuclease subunit [Caloramator proteoclasticus DSM 10124]
MKFLFFTDTHIRGTNPRARLDDFEKTLYNKFEELLSYVRLNNIDYVLFGGDLLDRPDVSLSVMQKFIDVLNKFPKPIYMVLGNHDIYGQNPNTVNRTIIGILETLGIVWILDDKPVELNDGKVKIKITGSSFTYDIDVDSSKSKYITNKGECDYLIHIAHGMLMEKPFIKEVPHTTIDEIIQRTEADITLCGHYHTGYGIIKIENKYIVNPGAIVRINNSIAEIKRQPSFAVIDINENISVYIEKLKSAPRGEDILDRSFIKIQEQREILFNNIIQTVNTYGEFEMLSINQIVEEVAKKESIPDEIKKEVLDRLTRAHIILSKEVVD